MVIAHLSPYLTSVCHLLLYQSPRVSSYVLTSIRAAVLAATLKSWLTYKAPKPISGALVLNELNLAIFKPFLPGMRVLEGNITMAGGLGGTLDTPQFYGDVKLANGRIAMLDLPVNLTNINTEAKIRGTQATIDGSFKSGTGNGTLTGTVNWQQKLQAKLSVVGERLVITQPPLLVAEINPDIDIIVRPTDRYVDIKGAVTVPSATIRPPEASEDIITQTEDAVVLDRRLIGNINDVLAVSKPWSINADVGVDLGDDINFRGFGAVIPLAGAINITQSGTGVMRARVWCKYHVVLVLVSLVRI